MSGSMVNRRPWMNSAGASSGYDPQNTRRQIDRRGGQYSEDYFVYSSPPVTIAPGAPALAPFTIQNDSGFEWIATTAFITAAGGTVGGSALQNISVQVTDGGSSRNLFNQACPIGLLAGPQGTFPYILPIPRKFLAKSSVQVAFFNYDTAITYTVQLSFIGRKIFTSSRGDIMERNMPQFRSWSGNDGRLYAEDYFIYVFTPGNVPNGGTVAAGTTSNISVIMEADSDFEWILTSACCLRNTTTGSQTPNPLMTWQVTDGGSQRMLFSNATFLSCNSGNSGNPFINPVPRIFLAKTTVQVTLNNIDAVNLNNVAIAMAGRKIFEVS